MFIPINSSLDLNLIFESDKDQKYVILIFESMKSYLGRKV